MAFPLATKSLGALPSQRSELGRLAEGDSTSSGSTAVPMGVVHTPFSSIGSQQVLRPMGPEEEDFDFDPYDGDTAKQSPRGKPAAPFASVGSQFVGCPLGPVEEDFDFDPYNESEQTKTETAPQKGIEEDPKPPMAFMSIGDQFVGCPMGAEEEDFDFDPYAESGAAPPSTQAFTSIGDQFVGMPKGAAEEDFDFDPYDEKGPDQQPPGLEKSLEEETETLAKENARLQYENAMLMRTTLEAATSAQTAAQFAFAAQYQNFMLPQFVMYNPMAFQMGVVPAEDKKNKKAKARTKKPKAAAKPEPKPAPKSEVPETTVVLRNIPKAYSRAQTVDFLEKKGFGGKFDFIYVPFDFKFNESVGFAFVNFVSHEAAEDAFKAFNDFTWECSKPGKECKVNWASPHQGLEAHIEHFRNSPVMHEDVKEEYKPALFQDGKQISFPKPTVQIRPPRTRPGHVTGRRSQFAEAAS